MPLSFTRKASAVFRNPRNLVPRVGPRVAIGFNFRSAPQSRFDFPLVLHAADCLTPDCRSRAGGHPSVRPPSDLRSRSRPLEESGRQGLAVSSPPPRVLRRENGTFPRAAAGRVYGLWFASDRLDATRAALRAYVAIQGGCRPGVAGTRIRFPAPAPPQGIKWTTTCLAAMIFVCIRTVSDGMEGSSASPIRPYERRDWKRPPLSEYRICTSLQKLHLRQGRLGCV
jgi:hypothetical protein